MSTEQILEFFDGFSWAVPRAFAEPVAACRFELGDTLYENAGAYDLPWAKALKSGRAVQVLEPSRGVSGKTGGQDDSAFADSWRQEVVLDLHDLPAGKKTRMKTTQGRLYTLLWKGDVAVLDTTTEHPVAPAAVSLLKKQLEDVVPHFATELALDPSSPRYLMATDQASGLQREKFLKVATRLEAEFKTSVQRLPANDLKLPMEFLPTAQVVCFTLSGAQAPDVEQALQDVLYKPAAGRKTEAVRFRLNAHGLLLAD